MENLDTLTKETTVEKGKITLNVSPQLDNGTEVEVTILPINQYHSDRQGDFESNHPSKLNNNGMRSKNYQNAFSEIGLIDELVKSVNDLGYKYPTPVQQQTIPLGLKGNDVLATAKTGSGKSAAFILPILQRLLIAKLNTKQLPRALVLTPTRELAQQIANSTREYGQYIPLTHVTIYGGVSPKSQIKKLQKGIDIIIATPGRLIDLINQGYAKLDDIEMFVLDEADRMLDMGFISDIKRVIREMPMKRQVLLFSATIPSAIKRLAKEIQHKPKIVTVDPSSTTVETVENYVFFVEKKKKFDQLIDLLNTEPNMDKVLIFRRTKRDCEKLVKKLKRAGFSAGRIHGNRTQKQRERTLKAFRDDKLEILVGTDVASRGIDVDNITHVVNYEITNEPEVFIHRIGRTARAGKQGIAFNFCAESEREFVKNIEILTQEHMDRSKRYRFKTRMPEPKMTLLKKN